MSAGLFGEGRAAACTGAVALISLLAFEALAVAAAMPAVAQALNGLDAYALAFGGPVGASVFGMVLAGHWSDRHGAFRPTLIGLLLFAAGLLLATVAPAMDWLVAGRILQGCGSGLLTVALYVGMGQIVPAPLHPRLFSLFATAWVVPGLAGPALAAWLVGQFGWRSVFGVALFAVPVAAALLMPAFGKLRAGRADAQAADPHRLAWAALCTAGALMLNGLAQARSAWAQAGLLAGGLALAGAASLRLLPRGTLRAAPGLPAVVVLRGLIAASFGCAEAFLPLMLTQDRGWTLSQAGWVLSSAAVAWSLGSAVQARITGPARRRLGLQAGCLLSALGIGFIALVWAADLSAAWVPPAWSLAGFGIGLSFPILSVLTLSLSTPAEQGRSASALQLADALCTSAALAVAGLLTAAPGQAARVLVLAAALGFVATGLAARAFAR